MDIYFVLFVCTAEWKRSLSSWAWERTSVKGNSPLKNGSFYSAFIQESLSAFRLGPSHMSLFLRPRQGATLSKWSLGDGTPLVNVDGDYFVYYSHGLQALPWRFWIEMKVRGVGILLYQNSVACSTKLLAFVLSERLYQWMLIPCKDNTGLFMLHSACLQIILFLSNDPVLEYYAMWWEFMSLFSGDQLWNQTCCMQPNLRMEINSLSQANASFFGEIGSHFY